MKFRSHRLWFCSYHLQGFDTGLSTRDSVQQKTHPGKVFLDYFIEKSEPYINVKYFLVYKFLKEYPHQG